MEQDTSLIPSNYINSPFAYARLLNKYNRTQLHLLLRVTERIQKYIKKFYNSDLKNSTARPQPLFSEEDKRDMERMVVSFSELGITTNNIPNVQEKIDLQIAQSRYKLSEAQKRLSVTQKNIASANENLRCANIGFREGVMETTDVMAAQTAWQQAQSQHIDAQIDLRMSQIGLRRALGVLY